MIRKIHKDMKSWKEYIIAQIQQGFTIHPSLPPIKDSFLLPDGRKVHVKTQYKAVKLDGETFFTVFQPVLKRCFLDFRICYAN